MEEDGDEESGESDYEDEGYENVVPGHEGRLRLGARARPLAPARRAMSRQRLLCVKRAWHVAGAGGREVGFSVARFGASHADLSNVTAPPCHLAPQPTFGLGCLSVILRVDARSSQRAGEERQVRVRPVGIRVVANKILNLLTGKFKCMQRMPLYHQHISTVGS